MLGFKDSNKLFELADILDEIENNMDNPKYKDLLSYYNTSLGVIPIVNKLPYNIQDMWTSRAYKYKSDYDVPFPPFSCFTGFIREISKVRNDPGFMYESRVGGPIQSTKKMSSLKTEVYSSKKDIPGKRYETVRKELNSTPSDVDSRGNKDKLCHFHNVFGHTLNSCRTFGSKPLSVRRKFIRDKNICFRCCEQSDHKSVKLFKSYFL